MEKKEKITLKNGAEVWLVTACPENGNVVGNVDIKELEWESFFNTGANRLFTTFKSAHGNTMFRLDDMGNIGMWITLQDTVTKDEYTDFVYMESVGALMVSIYVLMQCMHFVNADGHPYHFMTDEGVAVFYNRFLELMDDYEIDRLMKAMMLKGGYVEGLIQCYGYTPEEIFEIIDLNLEI